MNIDGMDLHTNELLLIGRVFLLDDDVALSIFQLDFPVGIAHLLFARVKHREDRTVGEDLPFERVRVDLFGLVDVLNELVAIALHRDDRAVGEIDILRSVGQRVLLSSIGQVLLDLPVGKFTDARPIGIFRLGGVRTGVFVQATAVGKLLLVVAVVEVHANALPVGADFLFRAVGKVNDFREVGLDPFDASVLVTNLFAGGFVLFERDGFCRRRKDRIVVAAERQRCTADERLSEQSGGG